MAASWESVGWTWRTNVLSLCLRVWRQQKKTFTSSQSPCWTDQRLYSSQTNALSFWCCCNASWEWQRRPRGTWTDQMCRKRIYPQKLQAEVFVAKTTNRRRRRKYHPDLWTPLRWWSSSQQSSWSSPLCCHWKELEEDRFWSGGLGSAERRTALMSSEGAIDSFKGKSFCRLKFPESFKQPRGSFSLRCVVVCARHAGRSTCFDNGTRRRTTNLKPASLLQRNEELLRPQRDNLWLYRWKTKQQTYGQRLPAVPP